MEKANANVISNRLRSDPLRGGVRRSLRLGTGVIATGLAIACGSTAAAGASAAPFPVVFQLKSLYAAEGGDGSLGFVVAGTQTGDYAGSSVSAAGDVNGDGIDDFIVGASHASGGGHYDAGESYVVFGSTQHSPPLFSLASLFPTNGGDGTHGVVFMGVHNDDFSAGSVSAAGDVNGDGIDDVIIGARGAEPNGHMFGGYAGETYVVFGSAQGLPPVFPLATLFPPTGGDGSRGFVLTGIDDHDYSGSSVSAAGDVNGDGIDDLIVGAEGADPGGRSEAGESYVVFGSTQGFPPVLPLVSLFPGGGGDGSRGFVLTGGAEDDNSGDSVSAAGDVNGDGIDDLIVAAPSADPDRRLSAGETYVVFGSVQGFPPVLALASFHPAGGGDGSRGFVLTGSEEGDFAGASVSAAGDVNGDGIDDLIVGASGADSAGHDRAGESYVVFGSNQGFPAVLPLVSLFPAGGGDGTHGFVLLGIDRYDVSGTAVSGAGDVNGDGIDDLIVGADGADRTDRSSVGETYVIFGSAQRFPPVLPLRTLFPNGGGDGSRGFVLVGVNDHDNSGDEVSAAGDVNVDGIDDLIIGTSYNGFGPHSVIGESYVVFGRRSTQ